MSYNSDGAITFEALTRNAIIMNHLLKRIILLLSIIIIVSCTSERHVERYRNFDFEWKFALGSYPDATNLQFDDSDWQTLDVPHDYSIEQPFDSTYITGTGGGFAYSGEGWYRKHFTIENLRENQLCFILFDGVMANSEVWINGQKAGDWPYGYASFYYDITSYLNKNGQPNLVAVKTSTAAQPNSRWYTGAGIYRHVKLVVTDKLHIPEWGVFATTKSVENGNALIEVNTELINAYNKTKASRIRVSLLDKLGTTVASSVIDQRIKETDTTIVRQQLSVPVPRLWSIDDPYLYQLKVELESEGENIGDYTFNYGIRTFRFDANEGFFLNQKHIKLKGTNNHHDGGPLGAACLDATHVRQLKLLKELGCNALRMSHNPPAPELLFAADSMGFVVIDEIFDEWTASKVKAGYAKHFKNWYKRDIANWIRRDRNHPSIVAWSIGNEIPEQRSSKNGPKLVEQLVIESKKHDNTRPFTSGCNHIPTVNKNGFADKLDLLGYNYHEALYEQDHKTFSARVIYGSETVMYPYQPGDCFQMHSYAEWVTGQTASYVAGEFIWTGFDYLGEAGIGEGGTSCSPWNEWPKWPYRGATCGMIDLCGFKKPAFWFRKALWTKEPIVYLAVETDPTAKDREKVPFWGWPKVQPHWNGTEIGEKLSVQVYSNVTEVELFLNDKSLGKKEWKLENEAFLVWEVPYEPGTLKAVGTTAEGQQIAHEVTTAGKSSQIELMADKLVMKADKQDLIYVETFLKDKYGNNVPFANNEIEFTLTGPAKIVAIGNGDQTSNASFKGRTIEAYQGKCLAIIQSEDRVGEIVLTASAEGIASSSITLQIK